MNNRMLSWTDVLKNELFFPIVRGESTGHDFVTFLDDCIHNRVQSLTEAYRSAKRLINSDLLVPDSSTMIDEIASRVEDSIDDRHYETFVGRILALKKSQPQDRLAEAQKIVDQLGTLSTRNTFYNNLLKEPLRKGVGFSGKYHCEAYTASLITLLSDSGPHFSDFEDGLSSLSPQEIREICCLKLRRVKFSSVG